MKQRKLISLSLVSTFLLTLCFSLSFNLTKQHSFSNDIFLAQDIQNKLDEYQNKYLISDISKKETLTKEAIKEVATYAKSLYKNNQISSYQINEESVLITNKCGLIAAFSPVIKGTYSGEKVVLNYTKVLPNMMIYQEAKEVVDGRQPLPDGFHNDSELMPAVSKDLANEFVHVSYDEKDFVKGLPLSKEFLRSLGPNQVVMMLGHGTYVEGYHSTLNTGREFSWEDYQNDPTYREDVRNGLIVDTPGGEAFTTRYIDKYVGDLTNTFIYFGECESAKDNALANCFLAKGAAALVANTEAISMRYGDLMQYTTVKNLTTKKEDGSYLTVKEALQLAKDKYGECDPDGLHSTPTLFGNENYSLDVNDYFDLGGKDLNYLMKDNLDKQIFTSKRYEYLNGCKSVVNDIGSNYIPSKEQLDNYNKYIDVGTNKIKEATDYLLSIYAKGLSISSVLEKENNICNYLNKKIVESGYNAYVELIKTNNINELFNIERYENNGDINPEYIHNIKDDSIILLHLRYCYDNNSWAHKEIDLHIVK